METWRSARIKRPWSPRREASFQRRSARALSHARHAHARLRHSRVREPKASSSTEALQLSPHTAHMSRCVW
eukprot:5636429-Amphidinium_carterae.1